MRIDPSNPRQGLFACVLFAVMAAGITVWSAIELSAERDREAVLSRDGITVLATVIEITERSRTEDPLDVKVRLPDGREAQVYVVDSPGHEQLQPGSHLDVRAARDDITNIRPANVRPLDTAGWVAELAPSVILGTGALIIAAVIRHDMNRRKSRTDPNPGPA